MSGTNLLGLIALVPLALNIAAPAQGAVLMPLCTGDGQIHMVPLPGSGQNGSGQDNGCCIKGCHAGSNRKKLVRVFEPAQ